MIIVYLSNRFIRIVDGESPGGKLNIKNLLYTIDTKGSVLNGTITDEDLFEELIHDLWQSNGLPTKGIKLLIDSTQFTTRVSDAPMLNARQTMQYVSREFTDVERISNPVYGCFVLDGGEGKKKAKTQRLFSMMAPREFVQNYIDLFAKMGITVTSVESVLGATLRLAKLCPQGNDTTCIFQFVDDMTLISLLMVEGRYQYSSRSRLFSDAGTADYAVEVARNVSNLLQFAKAQDLAQEIQEVYVAGFDRDTYQIYKDSISRIDDQMKVESLELGSVVRGSDSASGGQSLTNFAIALGGLLKVDSKTSLIAQIANSPEKMAAKAKKRKTIIPIAALAGVFLLVTLVCGIRVLHYSLELTELEEYNNSEEVLQNCEAYDVVSQQVSVLSTLSGSMQGLKSTVTGYPYVDRSTEHTIEKCAEGLVTAEISNYDSSSGIISFDTTSQNVDQIHKFITLLSQEEIFANVDYTGYSQNSDGEWSVNVRCTMAGRQEEPADADEAN